MNSLVAMVTTSYMVLQERKRINKIKNTKVYAVLLKNGIIFLTVSGMSHGFQNSLATVSKEEKLLAVSHH